MRELLKDAQGEQGLRNTTHIEYHRMSLGGNARDKRTQGTQSFFVDRLLLVEARQLRKASPVYFVSLVKTL